MPNIEFVSQVEFGSWLDGLGKVEWVVVASSFHTLFLTCVLERYPEAKVYLPTYRHPFLALLNLAQSNCRHGKCQVINSPPKVIGARQAQDKLNHVGALARKKFDYNSSVEEELNKANKVYLSHDNIIIIIIIFTITTIIARSYSRRVSSFTQSREMCAQMSSLQVCVIINIITYFLQHDTSFSHHHTSQPFHSHPIHGGAKTCNP